MPEEGLNWCTRADNAAYTSAQGQSGIPLIYPEDSTAPEGCSCAPIETHDWLLANTVNGQVVVGPTAPDDAINLRDNVYQHTANECMTLVPTGAMSSNCNLGQLEGGALDASPMSGFQHSALYLGSRDGVSECTVSRSFLELPADCSFVDGSYGITYGKTGYKIPQTTFDDFFENPGCFYVEKSGRIVIGVAGYEFQGITSGTLLYDLGLRSGDVPTRINGYNLRTLEEAFSAYDAVREASSWTLRVTRGNQTYNFTYGIQ